MVRNTLLFLAATLMSLAIGEAVVRALHLAPGVTRIEIHTPWAAFVPSSSEILLYEPKPGVADINAHGARDVPFDIAKPPGIFRIVVLGDSIGFGFCNDIRPLAIRDTFPRRLEGLLRERVGPHFQVINLSVSGYDTVQEAEMLARKGMALAPDLVLVAYCLNDAWQASAERVAFDRGGLGALLGRSETFRSLYLASDLMRFVVQRTQIVSKAIRWLRRDPDEDRTRVGFGRIAKLGSQGGFETLVVTFPLFESFTAYARLDEHAAVAARADEHAFHHLDLLPAFRAASAGNSRALQGHCNREHPDERGHALAAEAIAAYLIDHELVPSREP